MQTSYEVIYNALHFGTPDRLPIYAPSLGLTDLRFVCPRSGFTGDRSKRTAVDRWGCVWSRSEVDNMGIVTGHPVADWADFDHYRYPDPDDPSMYEGLEAKFEGAEDKFIITDIFMLLFERIHSIRGFQNTLEDLYLEPEKLADLADHVVDYDLRVIENMASRFPGRIHGINVSDDWGTELSTFISVPMFDEFFKPRYKKIFDACHAVGWDVFMHSCGKINDVMPSLIDAGVNSFNLFQPNTNGIDELHNRFAGKVCFHTACDVQTTIPFGSPEDIEREAALLMHKLGTPEGGFILFEFGDSRSIGVDEDRKRFMTQCFLKHDPWKK